MPRYQVREYHDAVVATLFALRGLRGRGTLRDRWLAAAKRAAEGGALS